MGSVSYPALRPYLFGPVRSPDVTVGHSSLLTSQINYNRFYETYKPHKILSLDNDKSERQFRLLTFSGKSSNINATSGTTDHVHELHVQLLTVKHARLTDKLSKLH